MNPMNWCETELEPWVLDAIRPLPTDVIEDRAYVLAMSAERALLTASVLHMKGVRCQNQDRGLLLPSAERALGRVGR